MAPRATARGSSSAPTSSWSAATPTAPDVYERSGGTTTQVSQGQINGNGAFDAFFDGASSDGSQRLLRHREQLVSGDTDSSAGRLRALGRDDDPGLPGPDQRQRRLRRLLRGRLERRLEGLLRHQRAAGQRRHRQRQRRLRALRGNDDPVSQGESTATAPSTPPSRAPRATARRSSSSPTSSWSARTPTASRTSTSAPGGPRSSSRSRRTRPRPRSTPGPPPPPTTPTPTFTLLFLGSRLELPVQAGRRTFSPCSSPRDHCAPRRRVPHSTCPGHGPGRQRRPDARRAHLHGPARPRSASRAQTLVVSAAPAAMDNLRISRPSPSTLRVTNFAGGAYTGSGVHTGAGCTQAATRSADCSAAGIALIQVSSSIKPTGWST